MKTRTILLAMLVVLFAGAAAQASSTGLASVGINFHFGGAAPAAAGDGAYPCDAWRNVNSTPTGFNWWNGLVDDQGNGSYNLGWGKAAQSSVWNGNMGGVLGLLKGGTKLHYYTQRFYGTNMLSGGWTKYDIYVYGLKGSATLDVACTNGQIQTNDNSQLAGPAYVQGQNYMLWTGVTADSWFIEGTEGNHCAFQVVQRELQAITVAGTPGSPADWGTGTTWDLNPNIPVAAHDVKVRHTAILAAASGPQTITSMVLDNANSDLQIAAGASLTVGVATVRNGAMTVYGSLNASKLNVSAGSATLAAGSTSTIPTVNVTGSGSMSVGGGTITTLNSSASTSVGGGAVTTLNVTGANTSVGGGTVTTFNVSGGATTASLTGGTIGTVNASAGTTSLATNAVALNVSGTGTVNTIAPLSVPTVTVSGGTLNLGFVMADLSVTNATVSGTGTVNTQHSYLSVGSHLYMGDGSGFGASGPAFGVKGDAIATNTTSVKTLQLNGGTVTAYTAAPTPISLVDQSASTWATTGNTLNRAITVSAGSKVLVLEVSTYGTMSNTDGWTFNLGAQSFTRAVSKISTNNTKITAAIYYLYDPAVGAGTVTGTMPGATESLVNYLTLNNGVDSSVPLVTGGADTTSGVTTSITLNDIVLSSWAVGAQALRAGQATAPLTFPATSGTSVSFPATNTPAPANLFGAGGYVMNLVAGTATFSATAASSTSNRHPFAVAVFSPILLPRPLSLATTDVELVANTWLDLDLATSAAFGDLIPLCALGTTLRIQGKYEAAVNGLANWWDNLAPHAYLFMQTDGGFDSGSGKYFAELTYGVPEPAALGLIGLMLLAVRKRRS